MRDCLTIEDHKYLADLGDALSKRFDFILVDLFAKTNYEKKQAALAVPIWVEGCYVPASVVVKRVREGVHYSQIFEQWEMRCYEAFEYEADRLSPTDGRLLLIAAGYGEVDVRALEQASAEAVQEAWNDLYGSEEE